MGRAQSTRQGSPPAAPQDHSSAFDSLGGGYELTLSTNDGWREALSARGEHSLGGSIGQPDAGLLVGGNYAQGGCLWGGAARAGSTESLFRSANANLP